MTSSIDSNFYNPRLSLSSESKQQMIDDILKPMILTPENVQKMREVFETEMKLGLARDPTNKPLLPMDNTYVSELPDGTEVGDYLGLDLGGTNFRIILLRLNPGKQAKFFVKHYSVHEKMRVSSGDKLFDFIAECIHDFLKEHELLDRMLPLGFTFSFPVAQQSLDAAILESWCGVFDCSGVVGKDAAKMLSDAINRRQDLKLDVMAIMNDTTATLVTGAFLDPTCAIGAILGTGSNGCYLEKVKCIEKIDKEISEMVPEEVVINPELGLICDRQQMNFIMTEFDEEIDKHSVHPGKMVFEKLLGGHFLGEYVRLILLKLVDKGLIFEGKKSPLLLERDTALRASDVSAIESDSLSGDCKETRKILERLGYTDVSKDDVAIVQHVCAIISVRMAKLMAVCIASLLKRQSDKSMVTAAIDGSLYKYHPKLSRLITQFVSEMLPEKQFRLMLADDGSGKGAALVAAVATRLYKSKKYPPSTFLKQHFI